MLSHLRRKTIASALDAVKELKTSANASHCYTAMRCNPVDGSSDITVLQLPKFRAKATNLMGADAIELVAAYLIDHPGAGDMISSLAPAESGSYGGRQKGKGKRGGAPVIYSYIVIAARIYLLRCYSKNLKTDLTSSEKKELRKIVANLKGLQ